MRHGELVGANTPRLSDFYKSVLLLQQSMSIGYDTAQKLQRGFVALFVFVGRWIRELLFIEGLVLISCLLNKWMTIVRLAHVGLCLF